MGIITQKSEKNRRRETEFVYINIKDVVAEKVETLQIEGMYGRAKNSNT